jgi:hypothetical protein
MANERITGDMNGQEMILAMSDGNPECAQVLMQIMQYGGEIDTDDMFQGLGTVMALDTLGVYGHRVWGLYKDVCGEDLPKTIAMTRAWQLGQLAGVTKEALLHAIDNRGAGLDVDAALEAVKERLPNFNTKLAA